MNEETIVAVFDTAQHAAAAVSDLEAAGIPTSAITQHAGGSSGAGLTGGSTTTTTGTQPREQGFWASLFGGEPEYGHDTTVYDRSLQSGSTVVTVRGSEEHMTRVLDILERHNPIDIDERAAGYGATQTTTAQTAATARTGLTGAGMAATAEPGTIQLSEEQLVVGKRAVNRGTTRVRRYVVETPVEEKVSLRDEKVTIERRPVTDGRAVSGSDFTDKVIEVTETGEEAVVGKTARVREEISIRKEAAERTETVRDTVRREDVEITKDAGLEKTGVTGTTSGATTVGSAPYKPSV